MSHHWNPVIALVRKMDPKRGAEVGTKWGRCSSRFLTALPNLYMYCVDKWEPNPEADEAGAETYTSQHWNFHAIEKRFHETMRRHQGRYKLLHEASVDAARRVRDRSLDFVFIDAQHTYSCVKEDILAWRPKLKPGGWMTGHDYNHDRFPGVVQAVNELYDQVIVFPRHTVWAHREGR